LRGENRKRLGDAVRHHYRPCAERPQQILSVDGDKQIIFDEQAFGQQSVNVGRCGASAAWSGDEEHRAAVTALPQVVWSRPFEHTDLRTERAALRQSKGFDGAKLCKKL